jgi:ribosomal protein S18 acetylase RimI-like enzyme
MTPEIRPLTHADAEACDAIVLGLPYHFGMAEGRDLAAQAVRTQRGLTAVEDGVVVGFCTFVPRFDAAAEITWMAVAAEHRRRGIGHALIDALKQLLVDEDRGLLVVLTVSPTDPGDEPDDGYQSTRRFYEQVGFVLIRDLPREWEESTAVLMAMPLGPPAGAPPG